MKHILKTVLFAFCICSPMYSMEPEDYNQKREYQQHDPNKLLFTAFQAQNVSLIKDALERGADPNSTYKPRGPLHIPTRYLHYEFARKVSNISIIQLLLRYNADPNSKRETGAPALHLNITHTNLDENNLCRVAQSLIVGGAMHTDPHFLLLPVAFIAKTVLKLTNLAKTIEQTAEQREALFKAVKDGENIQFSSQNDNERQQWISRCHARDINGNNLLHYALYYKNIPVAAKLAKLWPQLLVQPNFVGRSAVEVLEMLSQDHINAFVLSLLN